jgi:COP9 signalosome complex subunit 1
MAVHEAKTGKDTRFYLEAQSLLKAAAPDEPEAERDTQWVENTQKANVAESQRLEAQLKGYKNNLIKESIRVGYVLMVELGSTGEISNQLADGKRRSRQTLSGNRRAEQSIRSIQSYETGYQYSETYH